MIAKRGELSEKEKKQLPEKGRAVGYITFSAA